MTNVRHLPFLAFSPKALKICLTKAGLLTCSFAFFEPSHQQSQQWLLFQKKGIE
jgi:hypothetical protein